MITIEDLLKKHLCEFDGGGDTCEHCKTDIPPGQPIYGFCDGGEQPEYTYVCGTCAREWLTPSLPMENRLAALRAELNARAAKRTEPSPLHTTEKSDG